MKDNNNRSGKERITCPFFDELDAILGTRAASTPVVLLESSGPVSSEVNDETFGKKVILLHLLLLFILLAFCQVMISLGPAVPRRRHPQQLKSYNVWKIQP